MRQNLVRLLIIAFVCVSAAFSPSEARAHGVTLKVQHFFPADSPFHTQFLLPWVAKLEDESHGLLRFQVFPATPMAQLYDHAKDRTADIVFTAVGDPAGRFPAFEVFSLPFTIHNAPGASRALWEYVQANNLAKQEFNGVRLLAVSVSPAQNLLVFAMNAAAYKSLSDEQKKVMSANSGPETSASLGKILGAGSAATANQPPAQSAIEAKIKQLDERGLNGKDLLESAQALLAEHDPPK